MKYLTTLFILFLVLSCGSDKSKFWEQKQNLDDFGDPIEGDYYLAAKINGTVNGVDCDVHISKRDNFLAFSFSDKGMDLIHELPHSSFINVSVKPNNSEPESVELFLFKNMIVDQDGKIENILKNKGDIKLLANIGTVTKANQNKYVFELSKNDFLGTDK